MDEMVRESVAFSWFGPFELADNEIELVSTKSDPPKLRLAVKEDVIRGDDFNLGGISGNLRRTDGNHEEYAEVKLGLAPDRIGGAIRFNVRKKNGEQGTVEVGYMDDDFIVFHRKLLADVSVHRFDSDHGRFCFNVQDDDLSAPAGKLTVYDTWKPGTTQRDPNEANWRAVGQLIIPKL